VRLDGLLGKVEPLADLPVHQAIGHELENLELAGCRLLLEFPERRGVERDHGRGAAIAPSRRRRFEAAAVIAIPVQDLFPLSGVHESGIGLVLTAL
jgi:hypothetical protein